ncbi:hypothetical protein F4779DRAFT_572204 [Xylariaceae sp. FL0662B]|nr:hypothetical protein F4779DRAFT_572204 [Xylariaceae sp. FL0662B]
MSANYTYEILDQPGRELPEQGLKELQASLRELGALCLNPLPEYQVFSMDLSAAFDDKILVLARQADRLIGFVSAVILGTPKLEHPVIHSGLTCIHPEHQRFHGVLQQLFGNLFLHLLTKHPAGVWMTTVTDIVSSLVHMNKYSIHNFPSPYWEAEHQSAEPSAVHLRIAREFNARHRHKVLVAPTASFDERNFVFRGSSNHLEAAGFGKDIDDRKHWHRDRETSVFYRGLLRPGAGDEVLLVGFLDPGHLKTITRGERFKHQWKDKYAKL